MTAGDVRTARTVLVSVARHTPLTYSTTFSQATGAEVYLKCENLQRTGSFKIRGAYNRLAALSAEERPRGVIAASAGNHAQGVALAAQLLGIAATVYMPESTPLAKVTATQSYGAAIRLEGDGYDQAYEAALRDQAASGATFVHAFDDELIVAGQGTVGSEIIEDLPDVAAIVVPVGGGGLVSGIAVAAKAFDPAVKVFGVEASAADAVHLDLHPLSPSSRGGSTIADGIAVRRPGTITLDLIHRFVDDVVTVEDEATSRAIVMLLERSKLVVEGAGAVGLAAMLAGRLELTGQKVAVVLSGGNIDVNLMARIIEHGLATSGRYLIFETWLPDRPGELLKVLQILRDERVNILSVEHRRPGSFPEVEVMLTVETRDALHAQRLLTTLESAGYRVNRLGLGR